MPAALSEVGGGWRRGGLMSLRPAGERAVSERAEGVRVAHPLFQAGGDGSQPISALQLRFGPTNLTTARRLTRAWHSRLPILDRRVSTWDAFAAEGPDGLFYAAAVWGRPVARHLPQDGSCLELRRFSIAPDAPKNTASRMLGWMAREMRRRGIVRLVSYQDADVHAGTIYAAAGWTPVRCDRGGRSWAGRRKQGVGRRVLRKVRWEKSLAASSRRQPAVPTSGGAGTPTPSGTTATSSARRSTTPSPGFTHPCG